MENTKFTSSTMLTGSMRCHTHFAASGIDIATDVPTALGGRGEYPTPGALLAACVASCMLSMIAYTATQKGVDADGTCIKARCTESNGGIRSIVLSILVPHPIPHETRTLLEAAVKSCPVGKAIHPDITKDISWHWSD